MINRSRLAVSSRLGSRSRPPLASAGLQRLYPLLLLLAIGSLCWLLATALWLVIVPPIAPPLSPVPLSPPKTSPVASNALDIFAKPSTTTATQPPPAVKILGVTLATPEQNSYAILTINGKTQNYRLGNMLDGNQYKLTKIARDFIIVTDSTGTTRKIDFGQKYSLDQSDTIRAKANSSIAATVSPNGTLTNATPTTIQAGTGQTTVQNGVGVQNPPIGRSAARGDSPVVQNSNSPTGTPPSAQAAVGEAATAMQQNPAAYLSSMGVLATGQGYQVTDAMPAGLKNRLGLQTGDKIVSVNAQSVGQNPIQDAQLLQQIQQSGQAQIQVQRGSQTITVRQSF